MQRLSAFLFCFFFAPLLSAAPLEVPAKNYSIGEKFVYEISYLNIPIGKAEAEILEKVPFNGREAYHIVVHAQSYKILDWVYKVRDEHHSYIDAETLESLRYEKKLRQGPRRIDEKLDFNPERRQVKITGGKYDGKEVYLAPKSQDEVSCGYFFRTLEIKTKQSSFIPVFADGKNWKLEVKVHDLSEVTIKDIGAFQALEIEPLMTFQGIFVRKGKIRGWISADARRLPLKMKVKIPIGEITCD